MLLFEFEMVSWNRFGSSWGSLGVIFGGLEGHFGSLGGSWGALGGVLGRLGAVLGAVDGQKCRGSNFPPRLGRFFAPSWRPKRDPKRPQDEQKSIKKSS